MSPSNNGRTAGSESFMLGVDVGGTFTDIVLLGREGVLFSKKIPSTPADYSSAIGKGIDSILTETGVSPVQISQVAHGATVATNTIIERKGAKTALITTKGFRDVLELARYRIPRLYDFSWRRPDPLVDRSHRFEVPERLDYRGEVIQPLEEGAVDRIVQLLIEDGVESVAVCLIHSYANPAHEKAVVQRIEALAPHLSISASYRVLPQIQEYERTSTVVINAYIRPILERYVNALIERLKGLGIERPVLIMQSNGGVMAAEAAGETPIYVIESGPAAGVVGAQRLSQKLGVGDLITLDMGGTTAKASIIESGRFTVSSEQEVGGDITTGHRLLRGAGFIVRVPTIDVAEVGAGGGSIAWVDKGGGLHVGPRSAGANPGPICYNRGGAEPTVTDANLILGYLSADALLGGTLKVDYGKTEEAVSSLGRALGLSATEAAYGVHSVANSSMIRALKSVSTEKGRDPRKFSLFAFGGNGPVHAVAMAQLLGTPRVIVPPAAGLFSALGLLLADVEHHLVQAFYRPMEGVDLEVVNGEFGRLMEQARSLLRSEGFKDSDQELKLHADLQYLGQNTPLTIPMPFYPLTHEALGMLADSFAEEHERAYGYRSDEEKLQFVSLKVVGRGISRTPRLSGRIRMTSSSKPKERESRAYFGPRYRWLTTPVIARTSLTSAPTEGPLIIAEYDSTTVVPPACRARLDEWDNITIDVV